MFGSHFARMAKAIIPCSARSHHSSDLCSTRWTRSGRQPSSRVSAVKDGLCCPNSMTMGGFTGANMERSAMTKLLHAVEAGELDCVVVYKVDRLNRSLLDFTRMRRSRKSSVLSREKLNDAQGPLSHSLILFGNLQRYAVVVRIPPCQLCGFGRSRSLANRGMPPSY